MVLAETKLTSISDTNSDLSASLKPDLQSGTQSSNESNSTSSPCTLAWLQEMLQEDTLESITDPNNTRVIENLKDIPELGIPGTRLAHTLTRQAANTIHLGESTKLTPEENKLNNMRLQSIVNNLTCHEQLYCSA
jgi:hypothetical protein